MRTRISIVVLAVWVASAVMLAQTPAPAPAKTLNIAGKWLMTLELSVGTANPTLDLKQDGEKITGTYTGRYGESQLKGTLKGQALEFGFTMNAEGQDVTLSFTAQVAADGQSMKGAATIEGLGDATWTARRDKS